MADRAAVPSGQDMARGGDQADILARLGRGGVIGGDTPPIRIDTHAASIFLTADRAWKLKRAVRFGYLDFSTVELRRAALEAELVLNRRTAPDLYLGVHPVRRDARGDLRLDGDGDTVDWLLEMRRFPDDALLDDLAKRGALDPPLLLRLADRLVAFHDRAEIAADAGGAAAVRRVIQGNAGSMAGFPTLLDPEAVARLTDDHLALVRRHAALLDARARSGRVRHGHGDLHLANIAMIGGVPTPFDCLEFSRELATIDLLYDLAFLLMDCWHRGLRTEANILFNRYLDLSPADESALALLPLFLSMRAAIRAHVHAAQSRQAGGDAALAATARSYLDLAALLVAPVPARMVAIGGLSGTGKSALARALGGSIGAAPGARILRSDVLRKRAAGVSPETRLDPVHYAAGVSDRVYRTIDRLAAEALDQGCAVVADAVFARREERDAIEIVARRKGVRFTGVWLETDEDTRVRRVLQRRDDASDADGDVARAQKHAAIGDLDGWHIVQAGRPLADVAAATRAILAGEG